ncbi:hypothetical protein MX659_00515 [Coriobacteriia bacterium Es71-Z0120]|uniref:hypothetical protein n=1 Tax=Parvivirga hydrogeniphila TaxID=2939460 RepID=UPI00198A507D|nr:hypothetical protein [Parvivirga hydrogeniphila]MBC7265384.1 type II toxin-antitoxin system MqsR family toxin [Coriobacteriia bacterium]MCL4078099.1 hypothetical protein [Parvivirga hydrogeniphila]
MAARYDPREVVRLAREGKVTATKHVVRWLANHDYDVKETLVEVLSSLESAGRYVKSCVLKNDETADVYLVELEEEWYLKFWVDEDQLVVDVWSCCWDGAVH